jgi:hypothetical protein
MPSEREKIEAELRMSEKEKIVAKCKEVIQDIDELDKNLQSSKPSAVCRLSTDQSPFPNV